MSNNTTRYTKTNPYKREHRLARMGMGIRRGDTSQVIVWERTGRGVGGRFTMTLAEARAFKAFLDRELATR